MPRPFLTARWSKLCIVTYAVPREVLTPLLPPGLELDTFRGECFASLVAFDFLDTRTLGVRWPRHVNFPEVNLRFYVREGDRRGVCFIKELVPRRAIAWIAKGFFNEPYARARMRSECEGSGDELCIRHWFEHAGVRGEVEVRASGPAEVPAESSLEHFFKEHTWGFGRSRGGKLLRYRVHHPVWAVYKVASHRVNVDWEGLYGPAWSCLGGGDAASVILAEGSAVQVYPVNARLQDRGTS